MMFEGIPNWEDVVALRDGGWIVVLGSYPVEGGWRGKPGPGGSTATVVRADEPRAAARQQELWDVGVVPWVVWSDIVPGFEPGMVVVVLGPDDRAGAESRLATLRTTVPDAYLAKAW